MTDSNESKSLEDLYYAEQGTGAQSSPTTQRSADSITTGSISSTEERDYWSSKTKLITMLKVAIPLALAIALGLWTIYIQSINGPVNQLQVKNDNNKELIDKNTNDIDGLKDRLIELKDLIIKIPAINQQDN